MPQRTLQEAERALGQLIVPPDARRAMEKELDARKRVILSTLDEHRAQEFEKLTIDVKAAGLALQLVKDEMNDLHFRGRRNEVNPTEFRQRYIELDETRRRAERDLESIAKRIEHFEAREDDPEGYADEFLRKFPINRPDFSW